MKEVINLFKYIKPYKNMVFLTAFFSMLEVFPIIFSPFIIMNKKNCVLLILLILFLIGSLFSSFFIRKISFYASNDLRQNLFRKIVAMNLNDIKTFNKTSDILINCVNEFKNVICEVLKLIIKVPVLIIGCFIMMFILNFKISIILLLLCIIFIFIFIKLIVPLYLSFIKYSNELNEVSEECIRGITTIKFLSKEEEEKKKFEMINNKKKNNYIKLNNYLFGYAFIFVFVLSVFLILFKVSIFYILYLIIFLYCLILIYNFIFKIFQNKETLLNIIKVLKVKNQNSIGKTLPIINFIEFKEVSFNKGGKNILENVSFKINKGEMIGIVGPLGSGKNSVLNLLTKTYIPSSGEILINDLNLKSLDIHNNVSIVYQNPILFSGTIKDNLKYGTNGVSEAKIQKVTQMCELDEFILKQSGAFNYDISSKNVDLIIGQKISLARAILADRDVLIMDNALNFGENEILKNLKNSLTDKIIIVVSSNYESLMNCDKLLVLNDGFISSFDSPKNVLKDKNFKEMVGDMFD